MNYTDLYLRCDHKNEVPELGENDVYYEDNRFIVDYIGLIPSTYDPEGNVTAWAEKLHFNVRLKEPGDWFDGFESIYPATPYRTFA